MTPSSVLLGNGDGTFQPDYYALPAADDPIVIGRAGDFNHDGKPDIAALEHLLEQVFHPAREWRWHFPA